VTHARQLARQVPAGGEFAGDEKREIGRLEATRLRSLLQRRLLFRRPACLCVSTPRPTQKSMRCVFATFLCAPQYKLLYAIMFHTVAPPHHQPSSRVCHEML